MSSSTGSPSPPSTPAMRSPNEFEKKVEETKPSKSDVNRVIMDYLVAEGYPGAAEKFAQETNIAQPTDMESIRERVRIRKAIHAGKIDEAVHLINQMDSEVLDTHPLLHFDLLQLQLIEIIRSILKKSSSQPIVAKDFLPAIQFATEQVSPRAPTDPKFQRALEHTMALMIFPPDKMTHDFKKLLDVRMRERMAFDVNKAILEVRGEPEEAKIRGLVRARVWAEAQAKEAKADVPVTIPIGLEPVDEANGASATADGDAMVI